LPGTIYTAAKEIESAGGKALPLQVDVQSEEQVAKALVERVRQFGGLDILANNANAIQLTRADATELKRYDLMQDVNARGTFLCSMLCLPHLIGRENPHVLTLVHCFIDLRSSLMLSLQSVNKTLEIGFS